MTEETHFRLRNNDRGVSRSDINHAVDSLSTALESSALGTGIFSIGDIIGSLLNNLGIIRLRQEIRVFYLGRK